MTSLFVLSFGFSVLIRTSTVPLEGGTLDDLAGSSLIRNWPRFRLRLAALEHDLLFSEADVSPPPIARTVT